MELSTISKYIVAVLNAGWSLDNIAFGSGGGLLQKMNRDTLKFAFKCCYAEVNGKGREIFKQPVGASWKGSKRGRLILVEDNSWTEEYSGQKKYKTVKETKANVDANVLEVVYENGKLLKDEQFKTIRARAELPELVID